MTGNYLKSYGPWRNGSIISRDQDMRHWYTPITETW
jgi:hypothetical protein